MKYVFLMSSMLALFGRLMVFETPLSVNFWNVAWCFTWYSTCMSCALPKTLCMFSGISTMPLAELWFPSIFFHSSSGFIPKYLFACATAMNIGLTSWNTSLSSGSLFCFIMSNAFALYRVYAIPKKGSIPPPCSPAQIAIVPVGAIVVLVAFLGLPFAHSL
ncbi:Uncharacterised protein [uncultured archaeon]|nr:Uncharacterised protein [uncultured archaeon]